MPLAFILNPAKKKRVRKRRVWSKKEQEKWLKSLPFLKDDEKHSKAEKEFLKGIPFMKNVRRRKLTPVFNVSSSPRKKSRAWREVVRRLGLPRAAHRIKRIKKRKYSRVAVNEPGIFKKGRLEMAKRRVHRRAKRNDPGTSVRRYRRRRRSYASNEPARRKKTRWMTLVKKYGIKKAASKYRRSRRRRYARNPANPWYDDRSGHRIAAYAGRARRKHFVIPAYMKSKGVKRGALRRYVKRHGLVLSHSRYLKRIKPRAKIYAMNPAGIMAVTKDFAKSVVKKDFIFDGVAAFGGILGAVVGETIVYNIRKKKAGGATPTPSAGMTFLGNFLGGVGTGIIVTIATKNMRRGFIAASGGLAYGLFKLTYAKIFGANGFLKGSLFGMEFPPAMGDYVTFPQTGDYVEIPAGQVSETGQFIPEETGEFIPASQAFGDEEIEY
jgi:hypothetical protein